ncbi:MAG: NHLP bacteriocin export ABC transporter permease/ATPase subunit [Allobranchiibius sp.]
MTTIEQDALGGDSGGRRQVGADHPLVLSGAGSSWRVTSGIVEVFAVAASDSPDLARLHLMTATPGTLLFGSHEEADHDFRLLAVGGPDSTVQIVPIVSDEAQEARRLWIAELAGSLAGGSVTAARVADASGSEAQEMTLNRAIAHRREQIESEDFARVSAQRATRGGALAAGLEQLGSLLGSDGDQPPRTKTGESVLVGAFQVVANAQGVSLTMPSSGAADEDPLTALARSCGLRTRRVRLDEDWWRQDCGPMLAFLEVGHHPVALVPVGSGRYQLVDTAASARRPVDGPLAASLERDAFVIYRPLPDGPLSIRTLLRAGLAETRADLLMLIGLTCGSGLLALAVPLVTGQIVGSVIPGANRSQLVQLTAALLVATVAGALFQLATSIAVLRVQGRLDRYLGPAIWGRLLTLPTSFFRRYSAGDLAHRVLSSESMVQLISGSAVTSVLGGTFSIFSFGLIWFYSVQLGIAATILLAMMIVMTILAGRVQLHRMQAVEDLAGQMNGILLEFVSGISKLRVAGVQEKAFYRWAELFTAKRRHWNSVRSVENLTGVVTAAFPVVSAIVLFAVVGLSPQSTLSPGAFLAANAAYAQVAVAMVTMANSFNLVVRTLPGLQHLRPILAEVPEEDVAKFDPGILEGRIEFSSVSFRYQPDGPLVLDDVSIRVAAGSSIALVGPSGSGKSTLGRLLLGFEEPEHGAVFFDDQDLSGLDIRAVRRQLGVVLQSVELLPGSVLTNIIGSAVNLTVDDAWRAAERAGLAGDLRAMPMGMYTAVSEGGSTLSGGQRQRLLIARALAGSPRILLFDEATSALDNATQAVVAESLVKVRATRILIAHRLSTVMDADRIYYLEQGRIVEDGSYDELMALNGAFASQARRQLT